MQNRLALIPLLLAAHSANAQTTFEGDAPGARLGSEFDVIADINGDGVAEFLAGFPEDDTMGLDAGRALVISGSDGTTLRQHFGQSAGDRFGERVSFTGEFNSDGFDDYSISAPGRFLQRGSVHVFSGSTGSLLKTIDGPAAGDLFGSSIDRCGDVNGDGREDLVIGAPGVDLPGSTDDGMVYVHSGVSGNLIHALEPTAPNHESLGFGTFVSYIGDVNSDGFDDIFASSPNPDSNFLTPGHVVIFSGADGAALAQAIGLDGGHGDFDFWGSGIDEAGDVNADGVPDYLIGIARPGASFLVTLRSGADFTEIREMEFIAPFDHVGNPTNLGDVSGDGVPDQAYQRPFEDEVQVVSGASGLVLQNITFATPGVEFGLRLHGVEDVTGDGIRDIAIGIPDYDGPAGADSGRIQIFPGSPCATPLTYCTGGINSAGLRAEIGFSGMPSVSGNAFVLSAAQCAPNKFGQFFYGPSQIFQPFGDGFRCVGAGGLGTFRLSPVQLTDGTGATSRTLDFDAAPADSGPGELQAGELWYFQFWYRDPAGPGGNGFNLTNGLAVPFCP